MNYSVTEFCIFQYPILQVPRWMKNLNMIWKSKHLSFETYGNTSMLKIPLLGKISKKLLTTKKTIWFTKGHHEGVESQAE